MPIQRLLVANRSEIAVRILRGAAELGIRTVAVYSQDDRRGLHVRRADQAAELSGSGPRAYLDAEQLIEFAQRYECDAIHPGYGFLSENAAFAEGCEAAGIAFVGPTPSTLERLGDKVAARALATECGTPVLPGTKSPIDSKGARSLLESLGPKATIVIKAVGGGGGRGMRVVDDVADLDSAIRRCASEAKSSFGTDALYAEAYLPRPRHIEVQIAGDGSGRVVQLGERDCSLQRRHQKVVEIAPAPGLDEELREKIHTAAVGMAEALSYRGLGTFEFLVPANGSASVEPFYFIEANPRLQVEHPVTEEVTGIDLVHTQLQIAAGSSLDEVGLASPPKTRGFAIELRINCESIDAKGAIRPNSGTLDTLDLPFGPGIRVDTAGYTGYSPSPAFDSLLAKIIAHSPADTIEAALHKSLRALRELRVGGIETNQGFLDRLLRHLALNNVPIHTSLIDETMSTLASPSGADPPLLFPQLESARTGIGATVDKDDPLAVLAHGKQTRATAGTSKPAAADDAAIRAPLQGTIVSIEVAEGASVDVGQELLILEAMKMEHVVAARRTGIVRRIAVAVGDTILEGHPLLYLEASDVSAEADAAEENVDLDRIRPDLEEARQRHDVGLDAARPAAVARRRKTGHRTARENIDDLCDAGSLVEYGPLVLAAQHRRRSTEELIEKTPADGLVAGIATINGDLFDEDAARCAVLSYDYTVLAGTQGLQNHRKKDRMFELAAERSLPVVLFAEGGGGRPGDTDGHGVTGLDCLAFELFAALNGRVPLIGITTGRCFAGNAALLGCCDVVIATDGSNIGMGGPAMVEGGGLGVFRPEEIGPMDVQVPNGVVDIAVADEAEAVAVAKRYLSYFQGAIDEWKCGDQRRLRHVIPENRLRVYDVRQVIDTLADTGSVLELRRNFGLGMVTALARIEGRPFGIVANNPTHLAGAIDSDGADKASRFMQLCDAFGLPIVSLCDTPGIMVGPEVEKTALVRHAARMFVTGAGIEVPLCTIVLRKGYGLGAQAMAGGSFKAPYFTVAWPTGEFGGMGLEGAVKLGFRNELAAVEDPGERNKLFQEMVDRMYQVGKAVNIAAHFEIDEVIDPMDSRKWILSMMPATKHARAPGNRRRIDTW